MNNIFAAFFLFGLINNSLYVVILSAASDLVGPSIPKALVLLFDVAPSFVIKLTAPFFIKAIPYNLRVASCVLLSVIGMLILAGLSGNGGLFWKMLGITLASLSSGLGEITFLSLTHYYLTVSLNAWSSGTGFAGIFGLFNFMVMTTWLGISTTATLYVFSILPFAFVFVFWKTLPKVENVNDRYLSWSVATEDTEESAGFLESGDSEPMLKQDWRSHWRNTVRRIKPLIVPYMVPLSTVYFSEYLINQGISPTLLFPIEETPFRQYRDIYVTYATLYQIGVFVSRSSAPFYRVRRLYYPAVLQALNLVVCILQSMYMVFPSIYMMFLIVFYEGLLGGSSYVNTFMLITEEVSLQEREFALGTVSISDSLGVGLASLFGMWAERLLCEYQVGTGREWCKMK